MKEFKGYTYIEGGVCASKGFLANGLNCGLNPNKSKNDLGAIYCETPCDTAAVYTLNKVKGAPIVVTKRNIAAANGLMRAVIVNSKNANTCNTDGEEKAEAMCRLMASRLGIKPEEVVVASTGVIGQVLPIEPIAEHIDELVSGLSADGNLKAVNAIMTTDTVEKEVAVEFELDGVKCHLGGMAKGSGMIHPNMATTLNFITSDVAISSEMIQKALSDVVKITYNCLSVDGDTSTNDMVCVMANGLSGNDRIIGEGDAFETFKQALYIVMMNMTRMLAKDGEGATKLIECTCESAPDLDTAIAVAKSVIKSPLLKCAIFGEDANWGRILCAIGYTDAEFDISKVDVDICTEKGEAYVCRNGMITGTGVECSEEKAAELLSSEEIFINVRLNQGDAAATAWGCDLTYDYVKINGDYRS
ncbi:MAG: bifunctional ornithine acetyltransferase/N-acetylglutamate synthase [Lachnospiraceae bacterium]|nr:bifunctional ornithine acetyltransferase/N-acetylglutamate synthase [Lachnospiraceae bacterium]